MMVILADVPKEAVIPKLKPTVPNADTTSKIRDFLDSVGSNIDINTMAVEITAIDKNTTAKALLKEFMEISLLYTSILSFPLAKLIKFITISAKVLVFIPPPVPAGDAPTHIKNSVSKMAGVVMDIKSTLLKPAVLGVVASNKAVIHLPINECP